MIITDSTLTGFTVINGSWGLQLGLFVGSLYNYFLYPSDQVYGFKDHHDLDKKVEQTRVMIILIHGFLILVNIL